jgi:hypothetical protein
MMKPSLLMMKPVPAACTTWSRGRRGLLRGLSSSGAPKKRRNRSSPPPKNSVISWARWRDSVRMFTTVGVCAFAMSRKVEKLTAPVSGAWFAAGTAIVCADDSGDRSRREAITMPTASEATAMSSA